MNSYHKVVQEIYAIPQFTTKNAPGSTRAFFEYLGCPGQECKIIHVAGTNGKGSTCAFLEAIYTKAGYRVGFFSSPHLMDICERIRVNDACISREEFVEIYEELQRYVHDYQAKDCLQQEYRPTFFETLFFMAMLYYARKPLDLILLETGLGGRLDATNCLCRKDLQVITDLGMDHMEYLGNTLVEIAYEKAGIICEGVPLVYAAGNPETDEVLEKVAKQKGSKTYPMRREWLHVQKIGDNYIDFSLSTVYYEDSTFRIHSIALYQMRNASLAVCAVNSLQEILPVALQPMKEGLEAMRWEGRMEEIMPGVILDGAHNVPGIKAFLETVKARKEVDRTLCFGVMKDKDHEQMIALLTQEPVFHRAMLIHLAKDRALDTADMRREFARLFRGERNKMNDIDQADSISQTDDIRETEDIKEALDYCIAMAERGSKVYIVGSLYVVGAVKEEFRRRSHD